MSDKMLKFINIGQQNPPKRGVLKRKEDFNEIYKDFIQEKAGEQASRCSQCGVPFCQVHCPLSNNIPDWLKLTAEGRLQEAYELSQSTNNMPEVCGRICPQDRLCEGNCVIEQSGHGTVTIGSVEKYITDTAWENGWIKPFKIKKELKQSIGIIGAGRMGSKVIDNLKALGCKKVLYFDANVRLNTEDNDQIKFADLDQIYKESDLISLHVPLNSKTNNMISLKEMKMMNSDVMIVNTSRGGIINEKDLEKALSKNIIGGAAIDVYEVEPYIGKLSSYDNCILTPHIGSSTIDCRVQMEIQATEEAVRYILNSEQKQPVPEMEYLLREKEIYNEKI